MTRNLIAFVLITLASLSAISQTNSKNLKVDPKAELVSVPLLNTAMNERDMAISPDGKEMFYSIYLPSNGFHAIIHRVKDKSGKWSAPAVAPFSGHYSDLEPAFSPDGQKLFFSSNRPGGVATNRNFDIWVLERKNDSWVNPSNLGSTINTEHDEFYPSVAANGNLYFTAAYKGGPGKEDIYVSRWSNEKYSKPIALDSGVNGASYEFNAFVTPDEKYILFSSFGRKDDIGGGDLYLSLKDDNGNWRPAKHLPINSNRLDYCPFVSFDRKTLFFTSERHSIPASFPAKQITYNQLKAFLDQVQNGSGNIYQVSWDELLHSLE